MSYLMIFKKPLLVYNATYMLIYMFCIENYMEAHKDKSKNILINAYFKKKS